MSSQELWLIQSFDVVALYALFTLSNARGVCGAGRGMRGAVTQSRAEWPRAWG